MTDMSRHKWGTGFSKTNNRIPGITSSKRTPTPCIRKSSYYPQPYALPSFHSILDYHSYIFLHIRYQASPSTTPFIHLFSTRNVPSRRCSGLALGCHNKVLSRERSRVIQTSRLQISTCCAIIAGRGWNVLSPIRRDAITLVAISVALF